MPNTRKKICLKILNIRIESQSHLEQACDGFRRVYGAFQQPPPLFPGEPATTSTSAPTAAATAASAPVWPPPPRPGASGSRSAADEPPGPPVPASPRHGQLKILEREVQSLRDRHQNQIEALARANIGKRKAEEEFSREKDRRRRLEKELDDADLAIEKVRAELRASKEAEATLQKTIARLGSQKKRLEAYNRDVGFALVRASEGMLRDVRGGNGDGAKDKNEQAYLGELPPHV